MDLLITPVTIAPDSKEYFIIDITRISRAIQQQGEKLGIGQHLLQFLSSRLCDVMHELFACILIDIRRTQANSVASLQLTNLGVLRVREILGCHEISNVELDT